MSKKVFCTKLLIHDSAIDMLKTKYNVVCSQTYPITIDKHFNERINKAQAIFCTEKDTIDRYVLDAAGRKLKVIASASIGFDHIDVKECKRRNIIVTSVPDFGSECIAEFAVGLLLCVGRRVVEISNSIANGDWKGWKNNSFRGKVLKGSIIGFVGMKGVGVEILKRTIPFGVTSYYYYGRHYPNAEAEELGATYLPFEKLLKISDFVISTCIFCEEDRQVFNKDAFNIMKKDAVFISVGSGDLVNLDHLYDALFDGKIGAAGLDIIIPKPFPPIYKLLTLPNIVLSPCIANTEHDILIKQAEFSARNILTVLEKEGKPQGCVY